MTLDEAIKREENMAEENQRIVDTGIVFDDITLDVLCCDDTEVIEEQLASYQRCAEEHRQIAEWLKELKQLKEQTKWVPVDERLPEDGEDVLVWYEYFRYGEYNCMYQTYGIGHQYDGHWGGSVCGTNARCIAWMPLPEPYKAESEDK